MMQTSAGTKCFSLWRSEFQDGAIAIQQSMSITAINGSKWVKTCKKNMVILELELPGGGNVGDTASGVAGPTSPAALMAATRQR